MEQLFFIRSRVNTISPPKGNYRRTLCLLYFSSLQIKFVIFCAWTNALTHCKQKQTDRQPEEEKLILKSLGVSVTSIYKHIRIQMIYYPVSAQDAYDLNFIFSCINILQHNTAKQCVLRSTLKLFGLLLLGFIYVSKLNRCATADQRFLINNIYSPKVLFIIIRE